MTLFWKDYSARKWVEWKRQVAAANLIFRAASSEATRVTLW